MSLANVTLDLVDDKAVRDLAFTLGEASVAGVGLGSVRNAIAEHLGTLVTVEYIMAWLNYHGYRAAEGKLLPLARVAGPKDTEIKLLRREMERARAERDRARQTLGVVRELAKPYVGNASRQAARLAAQVVEVVGG